MQEGKGARTGMDVVMETGGPKHRAGIEAVIMAGERGKWPSLWVGEMHIYEEDHEGRGRLT